MSREDRLKKKTHLIEYSQSGKGFIARVPALKNCSAFGKTYEEAEGEIDLPIPEEETDLLSLRATSPLLKLKPIETALKRVFGRDQFLAFLRGVGEAIPPEAKAAIPPDADETYTPDTWILGKTGIHAFYNPAENNVGHVFADATAIKAKHKVSHVIIVSPTADLMPEVARKDLATANIDIISISNLIPQLKKLSTKKNTKKTK